MDITIIGSGNVATYYGKALYQQGWNIRQVYSPTLLHAAMLANELQAQPVDSLHKISNDASVYLIAVKDSAFDAIRTCKALENKILIHCSGSNSLNLFSDLSMRLGVLWPLYSVKKEQLPLHRNVPIIIDASDDVLLSLMSRIAHAVSDNSYHLLDEARGQLHLNAVLVNNFTNHLYAMAEQVCRKNNLSMELLLPIMQQGIDNAAKGNIYNFQTGPAVRKDWDTIEKHLKLLEAQGLSTDVYKALSQSIINWQQEIQMVNR